MLKCGVAALAVILFFPAIVNAQTFDAQVQRVVDGYRKSAALSRAVKAESCPQWSGADRVACERACDAAAAFGDALAVTVPVLIRKHEPTAIKDLGDEHLRLLAEQKKFDKSTTLSER